MDYQFALGEEEAVGLYFPRCCNYLGHLCRTELRQIVNKLPCVLRVGYDEAKLEIVRPYDLSAKVMPLDHFHVLNGLCANAKVQYEADCLQTQKFGAQVIFNDSCRWIIIIADIIIYVLLWRLNKRDVGHAVSYLKSTKLEHGPVV